MDAVTVVSKAEMVGQLRELGVAQGGVLLVHTAFSAVRPVEGGPAGLIAALREAQGPAGTLVMPSWTGDDATPFDPATTPASPDLGIVPETFRQLDGVARSAHAMAFAALGPEAERITGGPLPLPPHGHASPVGRVYDLGGQVLLLGVGHDADTSLHLAELIVGVPYGLPKQITVLKGGQPVRLHFRENDHCCARFALMDEWLRSRGLQADGKVGHADARLIAARDVVGIALEHLARDPLVFLHGPEAGCAECDEARASIAA